MTADYKNGAACLLRASTKLAYPALCPEVRSMPFRLSQTPGLDCDTFTERLLHEERVLVIPGNIFGDGGNQHVRCCYATATDKLEEALTRMGRFVKKL